MHRAQIRGFWSRLTLTPSGFVEVRGAGAEWGAWRVGEVAGVAVGERGCLKSEHDCPVQPACARYMAIRRRLDSRLHSWLHVR
jgi:hypothetical protein